LPPQENRLSTRSSTDTGASGFTEAAAALREVSSDYLSRAGRFGKHRAAGQHEHDEA